MEEDFYGRESCSTEMASLSVYAGESECVVCSASCLLTVQPLSYALGCSLK